MDKREGGMRRAEELVTNAARSMKMEGVEFLWWPEIPAEPPGAGQPQEAILPLRVYKGNSWRSIEFAGPDIDGCVEDPDLLKKYESEVAQDLLEL
jgi:hypothetical protein